MPEDELSSESALPRLGGGSRGRRAAEPDASRIETPGGFGARDGRPSVGWRELLTVSVELFGPRAYGRPKFSVHAAAPSSSASSCAYSRTRPPAPDAALVAEAGHATLTNLVGELVEPVGVGERLARAPAQPLRAGAATLRAPASRPPTALLRPHGPRAEQAAHFPVPLPIGRNLWKRDCEGVRGSRHRD